MIFRSLFAAHSGVGWRHDRISVPLCRKDQRAHPPVISVVDDDASVRAATENLLRSLGYVVHIFASAEEFLRSAHFNDTSCVIADVQMPGIGGVELQALMLAQGLRAPFIFISAFPDETVRVRVLKAGATGFLTKPFDRLTLTRCLDAALKEYGGEIGE